MKYSGMIGKCSENKRVPKQMLLSQLLIAVDYKTWHRINAKI